MGKEIKLILEEPYYTLFAEEAKTEGRPLKHHLRRVIEMHLTKPRKSVPKPARNWAGDVWDGQKWVPYNDFHAQEVAE